MSDASGKLPVFLFLPAFNSDVEAQLGSSGGLWASVGGTEENRRFSWLLVGRLSNAHGNQERLVGPSQERTAKSSGGAI